VSSSSSEAAAGPGALSPRLAAAIAASVLLHTLLVAGLAPLTGERVSIGDALNRANPLRARLSTAAAEEPAIPALPAPGAEAPPAGVGGTASTELPPVLPRPTPYYSTRELDVRPGIMTRVEPEYPEAAARRFLSGSVRLQLYIEADGRVSRVEILRADPPGYFEESAMRAFGAARFSPGMKDGKPVAAQMTLEVSFDAPPPPPATRAPQATAAPQGATPI
jgi:TonB family protein